MIDWRTRLRDALRDDETDGLSARDRVIMRRVVVESVTPEPDAAVSFVWWRPLAVAAVLALVVASGLIVGRRIPMATDELAEHAEQAGVAKSVPDGGERRQVQFSTPGGTRIIWTIDPKFQLNEVIP
jgi:hypothetical protein